MDYQFKINLRGIIDLLSNHLYSGPEVYLRELLQNGVDAIRARQKLDPKHRGEIRIELLSRKGKGAPMLALIDNGVGLTEAEVHQFLATIGLSSKSGEFWERPEDFIGRFGIGLLSCFIVSDEIAVVTRSVVKGSPAIEWRGKPDGTYTVKILEGDFAPGTQVYLTAKKGSEPEFRADRVAELAAHFGGLLPYPITVVDGENSKLVNFDQVPWRRKFRSKKDQAATLLAFGEEILGERFLDAFPLRSDAGKVEGAAYVLPYSPSLASKKTHRVYLKDMLLSESVEGLLPDWAFFVKCVVNAQDLHPTASRESFREDDVLAETREALGDGLRDYLADLADRDPARFGKLIALHALSIKSLAVQDDEALRLFADWLPFETSTGLMTLGDYRKQNDTIRFVPNLDQFRQVAAVAAAHGLCIINGAYTYDAELLEKLPGVFPDLKVESIDPATLTEGFEDLDLDEQDQAYALIRAADLALQPFRCGGEAKKFLPDDLPALYSTSRDANFLRSLEQSKDVADDLWSSVLGNLGGPASNEPYAKLCFNFRNPLVRKVAGLKDPSLLRRSVEMLYIQALLLGHHPLSSKEMTLLNAGLTSLIEWGIAASGRTTMSTVDRSNIDELMNMADQLEHGTTQVGLLEEAVRLADLLADVALGYEARSKLISASYFSGAPEKAMVAFSWCLAQLDRSPEQFNEHETLWQYKWIIGSLKSFPQLSRDQITAALLDLGRRFQKAGSGMRPVYKLQYSLARDMGDLEDFHESYAEWVRAPRGTLSDCIVCDLNAEVNYLIDTHRYQEAMEKARPIFEGRQRCATIPHVTLARSLEPLLHLGRPAEAVANHRKGYRLIASNPNFLEETSSHVEFLVLTDNLAKAIKLFEAHFPWALKTFDLLDRFRFDLASRFLFDRLEKSAKKTVKLRLPSSFALFEESGRYDVGALTAWLDADAADLADRFDARNGNDLFARKIEEKRKLEGLVQPFPLGGRGRSAKD